MLASHSLLRACLILFLIGLLSACSPNIKNHYINNSFTIEKLEICPVYLLDINSVVTEWSVKEHDEYYDSALLAISSTRDDISFLNHQEFYFKFGEKLADDFSLGLSDPENSEGKVLIDETKSCGFALISYLIEDDVDRSKEKITEVVNGSEETYLTFTVSRKIAIKTDIFDLTTGQKVWSGKLFKSSSNSHKRSHNPSKNFLEDLFWIAVENKLFGGYPNTPNLQDLTHAVFKDLGKSLPRRSCKEVGYWECVHRAIK